MLARTQYRYLKSNESYISHLITALVTEDWSGVISQCTIDSWKECLVAVLTHSKEHLPLLCERLGERLQIEADGDLNVVKNSILCYICAGSIERIVDVWNSVSAQENQTALDSSGDSGKIQDLVEVVVLLNKALERQGKTIPVSGKYAELLSKYASLLASQGSLNMALTFIGNSQDDPHVVDLRERLYFALGHKHQPQPILQNTRQENAYQNRLPQQRGSIGTSNAYQNQPPLPTPPTSNLFQPNFNQPSVANVRNSPAPMNAIPPQTWNTAPLTNPSAPVVNEPPLTHPPRPPSNSSVHSASGASSSITGAGGISRKYGKAVLDPSVQSPMSYGQPSSNMYSSPYTSPVQQPNYNQNVPLMPVQPAANNNMFSPAPLNSSPMVPTMQPVQNNFNSPQPQSYAFQNNMGATNNSTPLPPPPTMSQIQRNPTPPPGWNDPPELSRGKAQVSFS